MPSDGREGHITPQYKAATPTEPRLRLTFHCSDVYRSTLSLRGLNYVPYIERQAIFISPPNTLLVMCIVLILLT